MKARLEILSPGRHHHLAINAHISYAQVPAWRRVLYFGFLYYCCISRFVSTLPKSVYLDHHDTAHYIPVYHRIEGFTGHEREVYKSLVSRLIHEGRVIDSMVCNKYSEKDKNQAKTDKTEHGMEKREKVKVNPKSQQVKAKDENEEILCFMGSFRNDLKARLGVKLLTKALDLCDLSETISLSHCTCESLWNGAIMAVNVHYENSFTYESNLNFVDDSPNPPPQPPTFDQIEPPQHPVIHQPIQEKTCAKLLAEERAANINTQPPQETSVENLQDQENIINSVQTFLRKFNRYSFFKTPKVLLLAWDRISEIKDAFGNKQCKPEDIQELFRKLLNDVQNIHEELAEYINTPSWNRPIVYYDDDDDDDDEDYTIAITPILSTEEPVDSLIIEDEHLDPIPQT
ncbi:hypothetical protein Tco_0046919 [Tanacetum coccineum]